MFLAAGKGDIPFKATLSSAESKLSVSWSKVESPQTVITTGTEEIRRGFEARGSWVTKFVIDGKDYGGHYHAFGDVRLSQFFQKFPCVSNILELGSLEGGHTIPLATRPGVKHVLGIEGRQESIDKARFVQGLFGVDNVEFVQANLEAEDLTRFGSFDAVYCVGVLYHLPEPWKLIEQIRRVSSNLFLWTHFADKDWKMQFAPAWWRRLGGNQPITEARPAVVELNGLRGTWFSEGVLSNPLAGLSPRSFWPDFDSLLTMLKRHGFSEIDVIEVAPDHPNGPCVTLAARCPSQVRK